MIEELDRHYAQFNNMSHEADLSLFNSDWPDRFVLPIKLALTFRAWGFDER